MSRTFDQEPHRGPRAGHQRRQGACLPPGVDDLGDCRQQPKRGGLHIVVHNLRQRVRVPRTDRLQHIRQLRLHVTGVRRLTAVTQVVQGVVDNGGGKFVDRGGKHPGELAGA